MSAVGITENVKGDVKKFEIWYSGREVVYIVQVFTFDILVYIFVLYCSQFQCLDPLSHASHVLFCALCVFLSRLPQWRWKLHGWRRFVKSSPTSRNYVKVFITVIMNHLLPQCLVFLWNALLISSSILFNLRDTIKLIFCIYFNI